MPLPSTARWVDMMAALTSYTIVPKHNDSVFCWFLRNPATNRPIAGVRCLRTDPKYGTVHLQMWNGTAWQPKDFNEYEVFYCTQCQSGHFQSHASYCRHVEAVRKT